MLCMISGVLFQPFIGFLLDYFAQTGGNSIPGVLYSKENYQMALLSVPIALLLSVVVAFFIKESYSTEK